MGISRVQEDKRVCVGRGGWGQRPDGSCSLGDQGPLQWLVCYVLCGGEEGLQEEGSGSGAELSCPVLEDCFCSPLLSPAVSWVWYFARLFWRLLVCPASALLLGAVPFLLGRPRASGPSSSTGSSSLLYRACGTVIIGRQELSHRPAMLVQGCRAAPACLPRCRRL